MSTILIIKGPLTTSDDLGPESSVNFIRYLESTGHKVVTVELSPINCTSDMVETARRESGATTIIIDAHGSFLPVTKDGITTFEHHLLLAQADTNNMFPTQELFRHLRNPVDLFLISCFTTNGYPIDHALAIEQLGEALPINSTFVTFANNKDRKTYFPDARSFSLPNKPESSFAERLFLSIVARGYSADVAHHPIVQTKDKSFDLWTIARLDCLEKGETKFSDDVKQRIFDVLKGKYPQKTVEEALATIEAMHHLREELKAPLKREGTPVEFKLGINSTVVENECRKNGLFEAMCAIAYYLSDAHRSAFIASQPKPTEPKATKSAAPDGQQPR